MAMIVQLKDFQQENINGLLKPIIYCCSCKEIEDNAVSLNQILAELIIKIKPSRRTLQLEKCFASVLKQYPDNVVIKDFDVLFNPSYKVDVLKILINTRKTKIFSVLWSGKLNNNRLIYAEEGYQDYKEYELDNYDVTCVI